MTNDAAFQTPVIAIASSRNTAQPVELLYTRELADTLYELADNVQSGRTVYTGTDLDGISWEVRFYF